jgi:hypothetical protein
MMSAGYNADGLRERPAQFTQNGTYIALASFSNKWIAGVCMGRGLLLWLIGIPIPIILLIWLFGGLH